MIWKFGGMEYLPAKGALVHTTLAVLLPPLEGWVGSEGRGCCPLQSVGMTTPEGVWFGTHWSVA